MTIIKQTELLGKRLTVYGTEENPLFLAKDVAEWIEVSNHRDLLSRVDDNEKVVGLTDTLGGNQQTTFLTEDGLYEVLMQSRKPIAKQFKQGVKQILKDIRKHGMYANAEVIEGMLGDPDSMITILSAYRDEKNKRLELQAQNFDLMEANGQLEAEREFLHDRISKNKPLVDFANAVANSDSIITITDLAKLINQNGIDIGGKRLCEWMRQNGYLCNKNGFNNAPTQRAMDLGLFRVTEFAMASSKGTRIAYSTKVTAKGQQYFINKFIQQHRAA